jgi:hypothetical protein
MYLADVLFTSIAVPRAAHVMFLLLEGHEYNPIARPSRTLLVSGAFAMFILKYLSLPASEIPPGARSES